jgi:hypothetical protein
MPVHLKYLCFPGTMQKSTTFKFYLSTNFLLLRQLRTEDNSQVQVTRVGTNIPDVPRSKTNLCLSAGFEISYPGTKLSTRAQNLL